MKITIELDDKPLKEAVHAQVGATLAEYTGKYLEDKAIEIIGTKLSRFNVEEWIGRRMDAEVKKIVGTEIDKVLGSYPEARRSTVLTEVKVAIAGRVQEALQIAIAEGRDA